MPDDLSLLDQLEEWLEAQVPTNLHDLPFRIMDTMERVSNEIFETLNIHAPSSISIPFPPFQGKDIPPPPPPPPASLPASVINRGTRLIKTHPYAISGAALALTVGLGVGVPYALKALGRRGYRIGRRELGGVIENGMLKEAIVVLAPSPSPPMLLPLVASLLKADYIVIVAVPQVKEAESLERRLSGLDEKRGLRVLIYNPEDSNTFPPFQRSLRATLTLRFPAVGSHSSNDPYNPSPDHIPHIHAFISLYPLNPQPPSQPGALPALPTLLSSDTAGRKSTLITLYPSSSVLNIPDSFASQVLTKTHHLLGRNLEAAGTARVISVYVGKVKLPTLPAILGQSELSARQLLQLAVNESYDKMMGRRKRERYTTIFTAFRDYFFGITSALYMDFVGRLGIGAPGRRFIHVEKKILRILNASHFSPKRYSVGQTSYLPLVLSRLPVPILPYALAILPVMPPSTGPLEPSLPKPNAYQSRSRPIVKFPKAKGKSRTKTESEVHDSTGLFSASSSEEDHDPEVEVEADLQSSIHTGTSRSTESSGGVDVEEYDNESSGSGVEGVTAGDAGSSSGLGDSWVGLDAESAH